MSHSMACSKAPALPGAPYSFYAGKTVFGIFTVKMRSLWCRWEMAAEDRSDDDKRGRRPQRQASPEDSRERSYSPVGRYPDQILCLCYTFPHDRLVI